MSKVKGQNFRILKDAAVVPEATNCSITMTANTEDVTTKDIAGLYTKEQVVSTSWQAQVDTYQATVAQLKAVITMFNAAAAVGIGFDRTDTEDNTTAENASFARSGSAILNDFSMKFDDRTTVATTLQFQGTGALS